MAEYIEREALLAHIKNLPIWWADAGGVYGRSMKYPEGMFDCEDVVSSVENALTVDVTLVVHGHWIEYQIPNIICCSNCDWATDVVEKNFQYCPMCGTQMDGGADND